MLYTIVPESLIVNNKATEKTEVVRFDNGLVEGVRNGDRLKITRIISSDPSVFLNGELCPGNYIKVRH